MAPLPYFIVLIGTLGEFSVAGFLAFGHGDFFPLYLASLYFVRERWSGFHFLVKVAHKRLRRVRQPEDQAQA